MKMMDINHQLRFGMTAALFSNHNSKEDRIQGTITHISANRLKLSLRVDELPDWTRNGKLGIDAFLHNVLTTCVYLQMT